MSPLRCTLLGLAALAAATTAAAEGLAIKPADAPKAEDTPPRLIRNSCTRPEYPWQSIQNKEAGITKVRLRVNDLGAVTRSAVDRSSGFPRLDAAAHEALKLCRFEPARDGKGAVVFGTAIIDYPWRLEDAPQDPWVALRALRGGDGQDTADFSSLATNASSAASDEQRIKILQAVQAAARKNAGCASVEGLIAVEPAGNDAKDVAARTVREVWSVRQCGYTMRYSLQMFFPTNERPSYWMMPLLPGQP